MTAAQAMRLSSLRATDMGPYGRNLFQKTGILIP